MKHIRQTPLCPDERLLMRRHRQQLLKSSAFVKRWLARQPAVKEESLTDWLLFDISERLPCVTYRAFTRHEEGKHTGADWEWWILFPNFSLRMRVQAKKLTPERDHYPELARTNRHGLQIERFLADCKTANAVPLYAFYSALDSSPVSRAGTARDGAFVADGQRVYDGFVAGPRKPVAAIEILRLSTALSSILRFPPGSSGSGEMAMRFLRSQLQAGVLHTSTESISARGIYDIIPEHILSLMQARRNGVSGSWENEFDSLLQGYRALLIHDFSELRD